MMPSRSMTNVDVDPTSFPPYNIDESAYDPFVRISVLRPKEDHAIFSSSTISVNTIHFNEILQQEIDTSSQNVQIHDEE